MSTHEDQAPSALRPARHRAGRPSPVLVDVQRRAIADFCKSLARGLRASQPVPEAEPESEHESEPPPAAMPLRPTAPAESRGSPTDWLGQSLPPRQAQILERLLQGDGEKQVARHLNLSVHTVHSHIKRLYEKLGVNSRSELLARFVTRK